ncbi:transporter, CPA2 family [Onchocerca flexuosa]|uniref:Transporter, CPA2 family n=1 Tax=Onchocerca flexuosa TaxID=387005 RepID=A0A238BZC5_9BILA|nr:transporter, CPA2 family [Onchocerca flexuosa]
MSSIHPNDNVAVRDVDSKSIPVLETKSFTAPISTDTTNFDSNSANWFQKRRLTFPIDRTRRLSASLERQFNYVAVGAGQIEYQIGVVAEQTSIKAKDAITRIISYKPVNLVLASAIIFLSLYVTFVSVLHRNIIHPIKYQGENITWLEMPSNGAEVEAKTVLSQVDRHINSALSVFILWLVALSIGSLFTLCRLPNIIGVLLTGIAFKNIPFLNNSLYIDRIWSALFRKAALTVILMRAGMGLDPEALRKTKVTVFRLGVISTLCESSAIVLAAYFIFGVNIEMSILFGTILSATGPAVTIPAILDLLKKGYGQGSGLPTAILASCTIDNMTCIASYTIAASLIFTTAYTVSVKLTYEIAMTFTTIVISVVIGVLGGRILWVFPHEGSHHRHFIRGVLLLSICLALNFGTLAIGKPSCGVISTVLLNMVVTIKWKKTNAKFKEADALALMWNFFAMQIMFGLIGFEFDIKNMKLQLVLKAVSIVIIGQIARILFSFLLSFGCGWQTEEHFFITFSFVSKATLQAALAPQVADKSRDSAMSHDAILLRIACVFAIFFLAPTGQLIFHVFGPTALKKENIQKAFTLSNENPKKIFPLESKVIFTTNDSSH